MVPTRFACGEVVGDRSPFGVADEEVAVDGVAAETAGSVAPDRQVGLLDVSMRPHTTIGGGCMCTGSEMGTRWKASLMSTGSCAESAKRP